MVGASLAGLWACESLRGAAYAGTITLVGAESHQPYDRPPLSKALLRGDWEPDRIQLRKPDELNSLGLDLRLGVSAVALDASNRSVTLESGETLEADGVIVATGCVADWKLGHASLSSGPVSSASRSPRPQRKAGAQSPCWRGLRHR